MGGVTATASGGDGRPMRQTSGNLFHPTFVVKDAHGNDQVKAREPWVAMRDTHRVDLIGNIDPPHPLVFTILLDFEKTR